MFEKPGGKEGRDLFLGSAQVVNAYDLGKCTGPYKCQGAQGRQPPGRCGSQGEKRPRAIFKRVFFFFFFFTLFGLFIEYSKQ